MPKRTTFQKPAGTASGRAKAVERYLLKVIVTGCIIFGGLGVWGIVATAMHTLSSAAIYVEAVPMMSQVDLADTGVVYAGSATTDMLVSGLPSSVRWLLVAAELPLSVAGIGAAVVLAMLTLGILRERPFGRVATWGVGSLAIISFLGQWGSAVLHGIARSAVAEHLAETGSAEAQSNFGGIPVSISLEGAPFAVSLILVIIAAAFALGHRLQRDTEGLV